MADLNNDGVLNDLDCALVQGVSVEAPTPIAGVTVKAVPLRNVSVEALPRTGTLNLALAAAALGTLLMGAGAMLFARRSRQATSTS